MNITMPTVLVGVGYPISRPTGTKEAARPRRGPAELVLLHGDVERPGVKGMGGWEASRQLCPFFVALTLPIPPGHTNRQHHCARGFSK